MLDDNFSPGNCLRLYLPKYSTAVGEHSQKKKKKKAFKLYWYFLKLHFLRITFKLSVKGGTWDAPGESQKVFPRLSHPSCILPVPADFSLLSHSAMKSCPKPYFWVQIRLQESPVLCTCENTQAIKRAITRKTPISPLPLPSLQKEAAVPERLLRTPPWNRSLGLAKTWFALQNILIFWTREKKKKKRKNKAQLY